MLTERVSFLSQRVARGIYRPSWKRNNTANRRLWKTTTTREKRSKKQKMTRNGGVRPAEKAAQEKEKEQAAKETAGKMELGDVDEEYYPSDARPAEKGELLFSRTLLRDARKVLAFIKSESEFEQFKENWQEMKGKKKSQGSMANGGVDPMSWRSGIFDRHKVALHREEDTLGPGCASCSLRNRQFLRQLYHQQRKRWILPSLKKWRTTER